MTVGSVVFRVDAKNPAEIYGGNWELLRGDASIRLGDGSEQSTNIIGNSLQTVPVPAHSHTATFRGNSVSGTLYSSGASGAGVFTGANGVFSLGGGSHGGYMSWQDNGNRARQQAILNITPTGTPVINSAGQSDAKIDVKGSYITVNVWKRIS